MSTVLIPCHDPHRFTACCPGCGNPVPAGQVMCSTCARRHHC